ncbi:MAG: S8 family peptidase, partial [Chloroflexi bacterium]|nr:S8 family peptidase [Chloroflexota bacterium]
MTIHRIRHAMIVFFALILAAALLLPASPTAAKPQAQEASGGIPTDRIIIKYKEGTSAQAEPSASALMSSLSAAAGVPLEYVRPMSGDAHVLKLSERLPESQVEAISASLMTLSGVEYAEPDRIKRPALIPNDASYSSDQWNLMLDTVPDGNGVAYGINAEPAWDTTTGSESVVVAVVDTGVTSHEDLKSDRFVPGYDFIGGDYVGGVWRYFTANDGDGRDADPTDSGDWITTSENDGTDPVSGAFFQGCGVSDSSWHGTHVAGILGAWSNNNTGIAGVDWNSKILPVRVLGKCGGYTSDIADGLRWAAGLSVSGAPANPYPAKVINLSLGGEGACSVTEQNAINDAVTLKGAVVVAAAGNESGDAGAYSPGNCNNVITVASTDKRGDRSSFSNSGSVVEISAPGGGNGQGDILSTVNDSPTTPNSSSDAYVHMGGTSMAAPHVSGVVSLMFAVNPWMTPSHVLEILQKAVTPFPSLSTCNTSICGAGIVNAGEAVRLAQMPDVLITNAVLSKIDPGLGEQFSVDVTVKNRGGSTTNSVINLQIYVDRNPMDPDPAKRLFIDLSNDGMLREYDGGPEDFGEFVLDRGSETLPANQSRTYSVIINNTVEPYNAWTANSPVAWGSGTHKLYAYVDANGINEEAFEDNNHYLSNPLTINPFIEGAPLYPKNNIGTDYNPNFRWNQVLGATSYRLYVTASNGTALINAWYNASLVCYENNPTCSVSGGPGFFLRNGDYSWKVQSYNATTKTYGAWSAAQAFKVEVSPGTAISPTGSIEGDYAPVYTWSKVDTATYYHLYVKGPGNVVILNKLYPSAGTCNSDTGLCTVKSPTLKAG